MAYLIDDRCVGCGMCLKVCPTAAIAGEPRKRHRILSAACVDCGACGRICPHGALQDETGRRCQRIRRRTTNWPLPLFDDARCVYCRACVDACPTACLAIVFDQNPDNRKAYPILVQRRDCIACRFCDLECPTAAITMKPLSQMTAQEKRTLDEPALSPDGSLSDHAP
jgi:formate hydrogenlyase subunit 6/NADH:ubiquinone oxidoreductase subunit I